MDVCAHMHAMHLVHMHAYASADTKCPQLCSCKCSNSPERLPQQLLLHHHPSCSSLARACSYIFAYTYMQIHNSLPSLQPAGLTRPTLHQRCRLCPPSAPAPGTCGVRRRLSQAQMRISADRVRVVSCALLPQCTAHPSQSRSCNCRC